MSPHEPPHRESPAERWSTSVPARPPRPESLEIVTAAAAGTSDGRPTSVYSRLGATVERLPTHNKELEDGTLREGPRRTGFHPVKFLVICFKSSCTLSMLLNCLWPLVLAAFITHYVIDAKRIEDFVFPFLGMIPSANLLGFAGRELVTGLPRVFGVLVETTLGSIVELILLIIMIRRGDEYIPVIQEAVLGSILANLLLCLGLCIFFGGLRKKEQVFHEAISETGTSLLLVAGMGLILPALFSSIAVNEGPVNRKVLKISRGTSVMLLIAYLAFIFFQTHSHHGVFDEIFKFDHSAKKPKEKLTVIEALVAVIISMICVSFMAIYLVDEIPYLVENRHVKSAFVGLILLPLVEKSAEHLTAIYEAWEGHMNASLAHILGSSIQTALFNTPLIVMIGWGLHKPMQLSFPIFDAAVLILAIIVVRNFLRHGKSNYLEGFLCVIVYTCLAICAFYYPNDSREIEALGLHKINRGNHTKARHEENLMN